MSGTPFPTHPSVNGLMRPVVRWVGPPDQHAASPGRNPDIRRRGLRAPSGRLNTGEWHTEPSLWRSTACPRRWQTSSRSQATSPAWCPWPGRCFRSILLLNFLESLSCRIQGLVPGNPLPAAFAALPDPLHGIKDAVFMVQLLLGGQPFTAEGPLCDRRARIALHPDDFSVFFVDQSVAAAVADVTLTLINRGPASRVDL